MRVDLKKLQYEANLFIKHVILKSKPELFNKQVIWPDLFITCLQVRLKNLNPTRFQPD